MVKVVAALAVVSAVLAGGAFLWVNHTVDVPAPSIVAAQGSAKQVFASAQELNGGTVDCVGTLPPGTYPNVSVPANADCQLGSSQVIRGNVRVEPGARLTGNGLRVDGNLLSFGSFYLTDSQIGGNVEGCPNIGAASCFIVGSVPIGSVPATASSIGANILVEGGPGGFRLENTSVGGGVRLNGVDPGAPFDPDVIVGNVIGGDLESQARFGIRVENTSVSGVGSLWGLLGTGHQVTNNQFGGQLRVFDNAGFASISGNLVGGSLEFTGNVGGTHALNGNTVRGSLTCNGNSPAAALGGNVVGGRVDCP